MATSIDLAVDTSALTAILLGELEAPSLLGRLKAAAAIGLCAPNRTELLVVIQSRLGDIGVERAKEFFAMEQVATVPLDARFPLPGSHTYQRGVRCETCPCGAGCFRCVIARPVPRDSQIGEPPRPLPITPARPGAAPVSTMGLRRLGASPNHPVLVVRCFSAAHPPAWDDAPEPIPDWDILQQPESDFEPLWEWDQGIAW